MQLIRLTLLADPVGYLNELLPVHEALLLAAEKSNDLRQYVISSLMVKQIAQAYDMLTRHGTKYYCYMCEPFVYSVEATDTISAIMEHRDCYVYNAPMAP